MKNECYLLKDIKFLMVAVTTRRYIMYAKYYNGPLYTGHIQFFIHAGNCTFFFFIRIIALEHRGLKGTKITNKLSTVLASELMAQGKI